MKRQRVDCGQEAAGRTAFVLSENVVPTKRVDDAMRLCGLRVTVAAALRRHGIGPAGKCCRRAARSFDLHFATPEAAFCEREWAKKDASSLQPGDFSCKGPLREIGTAFAKVHSTLLHPKSATLIKYEY